ncbi:UNVERIFIED_ORG: PepSY-associated transmembrane protein [Zoogloea ramigera]|uniref:PepSY domain-containing protein n=1 Tax=Duganella zoogloeoides TaxID=75659 RepID=A0ABZ0Y3L9_9BURK|nr:PepSY domain-containing protein [Duganella zoogloeoides]WQH06643.1 PepSY domain-containing protein [Duganella zoogloeoides]
MKQALLFVHKWLGVALALLFLVWFASGIVLYFVPFPSLTPTERLAGLPPLVLDHRAVEPLTGLPAPALDDRPAEQLAGLPATAVDNRCCLTASAAAARAGLRAAEARLGMHADMPVWRLLRTAPDKRWIAVDASTGALLPDLSTAQAMAVAEAFSGRRAIYAEALERDQWTVAQGFNPYRPLVRVELDGDDGLELYVSPGAAEVVGATRRAERAWNWVGAIPHWIYFTELRRWPERWHNVVVWLSLPGVLLAATGLIIGVWQLFLNRSRWIPYRVFWMRWHHILGLAVGVVTLTWIFSGLMSMNPFSVFSPRGATADEQRRWSGQEVAAQLSPAAALRLAAPLQVRELETLRFDGQAWYRLRGVDGSVLVRADGVATVDSVVAASHSVATDGAAAAGGITAADDVDETAATASDAAVIAALPAADISAALGRLRAEAPVTLSRLTAYDELYYARGNQPANRQNRPLPVWRAAWADGVVVYADPASARIVLRAEHSNRWQRLLYNGLHSFDFAPLLARPWLRDSLVVLLSLLGVAMSVTACVVAWRVFVPRKRRR